MDDNSGLVAGAASQTLTHWVAKSGIDPLDAMLPRMSEFVAQLHYIAQAARSVEPSSRGGKGQVQLASMDEDDGRF